jgi:hypothetical protein
MNIPTTTTASGNSQLVGAGVGSGGADEVALLGPAGGGGADEVALLGPAGGFAAVRGAESTAVDVPADSRGGAPVSDWSCPFLGSVT